MWFYEKRPFFFFGLNVVLLNTNKIVLRQSEMTAGEEILDNRPKRKFVCGAVEGRYDP